MTKKLSCSCLVLALCGAISALPPDPVLAGWLIVEENGSTTYIQDGRLKSRHQQSQGGEVILDGPAKQMTFVDPASRRYARGTVEEFCRTTSAMLDSVMAEVPPEYRQMMKQMMNRDQQPKAAPPQVKVVKGGNETIVGLKTTRYSVMVNGALAEEIWLTNDTGLKKDWEPMGSMIQDFEACNAKMKGMAGDVGGPETSVEYQKLMQKGWPLKTVNHQQGQARTVSNVIRLEKQKMGAEMFKPPAGYTAVSFSEFMGAQDMGRRK